MSELIGLTEQSFKIQAYKNDNIDLIERFEEIFDDRAFIQIRKMRKMRESYIRDILQRIQMYKQQHGIYTDDCIIEFNDTLRDNIIELGLEEDFPYFDDLHSVFEFKPTSGWYSKRTERKDKKGKCRICLSKLKKSTKIKDCGHTFCSNCLKKWIIESSHGGMPSCPLCRRCIE
jgi:hypothetical protein